MKTRISRQSWLSRFGKKPKSEPTDLYCNLATINLLAHPDLARMSQTELADLPFDPYRLS